MLLSAEKSLTIETLAQNLDLVLRVLPEEVLGEQALDSIERHATRSSSVGFTDRTESMSGHSDSHDISAIGVLDDDAGQLDSARTIRGSLLTVFKQPRIYRT